MEIIIWVAVISFIVGAFLMKKFIDWSDGLIYEEILRDPNYMGAYTAVVKAMYEKKMKYKGR